MIVLGCDPSLTAFGWTVVDTEIEGPDQLIGHGVIKTSSDELYIKRYLHHKESLREIVETYDVEYAGIERPPPNSSWSAGLYPVWMYASEVFFKNRISFCILMPPTLKKFAREILGVGGQKMEKQDMKAAAKKLMDGYKGKGRMNHNVADAYLEAYYAGRFKKCLDGELSESDLTEKEKDTFTKTIKRRKTGRIDKVGMVYNEGEKHYDFNSDKYDEHYEEQKSIFD